MMGDIDKALSQCGASILRLEELFLFQNILQSMDLRIDEVDELAGDYLNNKRSLFFQKLFFRWSLASEHTGPGPLKQ